MNGGIRTVLTLMAIEKELMGIVYPCKMGGLETLIEPKLQAGNALSNFNVK